MKKLLLLPLIFLSIVGYSQMNTFGGIGLRVNDTTTYQTNAAAYHTAGYYDIYFNNQATNDHWDVWNGSSYDHVFSFVGVTTMAAIGSTANANGATISGSTLNLEPASASFGGVVTTGAQTIPGAKSFAEMSTFRAGTTAANTAPWIAPSGSFMTTPQVGAFEFLTDKPTFTITTGEARKEFTLNDAALTSGRIPYTTTNGRLTSTTNFTFNGSSFAAALTSTDNFFVRNLSGAESAIMEVTGSGGRQAKIQYTNTGISYLASANSSGATLGISNSAGSESTSSYLQFGPTGSAIVFGTSGFNGLRYSGDFSANYTDRSLTDRGYVLGAKTYTGTQTFRTGGTGATTAPWKAVSGALNTTAEVGAFEFLTDKPYFTITTGAARKEFTLNDAALTPGTIPVATTNGRLTDSNFTTINLNRSLTTETTQVGNVGTGEDQLFSYTIPAATLAVDGNSIQSRFSGTFAANGNSKTLKVKFGATTIVSTAGAFQQKWVVDCEVIRTGAATQKCNCTVVGSDSGITHSTYFTAAETLSGTVALVVTGEATDTNDIVKETAKVKFEN